MKKVLLILGGFSLAVAMLGAGWLSILWLNSDDSVTVDVENHSGMTLQHLVLSVPGSFPPSRANKDIEPGSSFGTSGDRHRKFKLRLTFDAQGRHFDFPAEIHINPFAMNCSVRVSIDDNLKMSVRTSTH